MVQMFSAKTNPEAGTLYGRHVHPMKRPIADSGIEMVCDTHRSQLIAAGIDVFSLPRMAVLECGGTGRDALGWIRLGAGQVTHIDLSHENVARLKDYCKGAGIGNLEAMQGDILEIELPLERFDIVRSRGVWHHLADPAKGLLRYAAWCRTGGYVHLNAYRAGTYFYYGVKLFRELAAIVTMEQMIEVMKEMGVSDTRAGCLLDDFFVPFMHTAGAQAVEGDFAKAGLKVIWPPRRDWALVNHEIRYPDMPEKAEHIQYWLLKERHYGDDQDLATQLAYHAGEDDIALARSLPFVAVSLDAFMKFKEKASAATDKRNLCRLLAELYIAHHYDIAVMQLTGAQRHERLALLFQNAANELQ